MASPSRRLVALTESTVRITATHMQRIDLLKLVFGSWRTAQEAHIANAVHLVLVLAGLAYARMEEGMGGPAFDFIAVTAIATAVVFGVVRLMRVERAAG